jgi:hypothetical protein
MGQTFRLKFSSLNLKTLNYSSIRLHVLYVTARKLILDLIGTSLVDSTAGVCAPS